MKRFSLNKQVLSKILALLLIIGLPAAIFAAKVKVTGDSFTGEKVITYEISHKFTEGNNLIKEKDICVYKRAVKNNTSKTVVQLSLTANLKPEFFKGGMFPMVNKISPKAFFQIDGKVFDISLEKGEPIKIADANISGDINVSINTNGMNTVDFKPSFTFTKEMEDAMKQAKSVKLRIYADDQPVTLEVKPKDVEKLVEMFNMQ
jgi:hypothetical protein